jgi:hypothetical protein
MLPTLRSGPAKGVADTPTPCGDLEHPVPIFIRKKKENRPAIIVDY